MFALLPFFLVFSSCSENDDEPAGNNSEVISKLLGNWMYDGLTANGGVFEESPSDDDEIYEFKTGGVVTITFDDDDGYSGTYTVNNNSLTIRIEGESATYTITQLTNTSLRLSARIEADENPGLDDVVFYFTRI